MRGLSLTKEKMLRERNHLIAEMKKLESQIKEYGDKHSAQNRLIQNVYGHNKN